MNLPVVIASAADMPAAVVLKTHDQGDFSPESFRFQFHSDLRTDPKSSNSLNSTELNISRSDFPALDIDLLRRLAAGEIVAGEHPFQTPRITGKWHLFWWRATEYDESFWSDSPLPFLEFQPDDAVVGQMPVGEWQRLRFPGMLQLVWNSESVYRFLHAKWRRESVLPEQMEPDDDLLCFAVIENYEHLVEDILAGRRIEPSASRTKEITETALGVAMENAGIFAGGPSLMSGCHRDFREDDFCEAEDPATWIPRAKRIGLALRAAGAVDYSPLIEACGDGKLEAVRAMLDDGYPPNFAIYGYSTPLLEAVVTNQAAICRLLLDRGANPNQRRPFESSMTWGGSCYPLQFTLANPELFHLLMDAGADPSNCYDDSEQTPVVFMGGYKTEENARSIFERVDFASICSPYGKTGVHLLGAGDLALCRSFIPKDLLDRPNDMGQTPLVQAITNGNGTKAALLLEMGASPSKRSWVFNISSVSCRLIRKHLPCLLTPSQAALFYSDVRILEACLAKEANPESLVYSIDCSGDLPGSLLRDLFRRFQEDLNHNAPISDAPQFGALASAIRKECKEWSLFHFPRLPADAAALKQRYPEIVCGWDVLKLAEEAEVEPHVLATWKAGRPLHAREWLELAADTISEANIAAEEFGKTLAAYDPADESDDLETPCYRSLLHAIDQAAYFLDRAREEILELAPVRRTLSADICAIAAEEFDGGAARARKNMVQDEGVEFDDFLDALREGIQPGSTMDLGKLLQASRNALAQLDAESVELMRHL